MFYSRFDQMKLHISTNLVSFRLFNWNSIMWPCYRRYRIRFNGTFEQKTLAVVFLANGWFLNKCWCNAINLPAFIKWKEIEPVERRKKKYAINSWIVLKMMVSVHSVNVRLIIIRLCQRCVWKCRKIISHIGWSVCYQLVGYFIQKPSKSKTLAHLSFGSSAAANND